MTIRARTMAAIALALLVFLMASPGKAQRRPPPGPRKSRFQGIDTNGDGVLSIAELLAHEKERFAELDPLFRLALATVAPSWIGRSTLDSQ